MSELIISNTAGLPVPAPRVPISIRPAVLSDLPFMDALQKKHTKMVGFFPTSQFEGNIRAGRVLIAEEVVGSGLEVVGCEDAANQQPTANNLQPTPVGYPGMPANRTFNVVWVSESRAVGDMPTPSPDAVVRYVGETVRLSRHDN